MKDKIICAIKNNLSKCRKYGDTIILERFDIESSNVNTMLEIEIEKDSEFKIKEEIKIYTTWWGKTKESVTKKRVFVGHYYHVKAFNKSYEITEEEYNDVVEAYKEESRVSKINYLNKLCNK